MKRFMLVILMGLFIAIAMLIIDKKQLEAETFSADIKAKAIIVVDSQTGETIYEQNSTEQLAVAGVAKMMAEYLVFNDVDAYRIDWKSKYKPSDYVLSISEQPSFVNLGMRKGEEYAVDELFQAMSIASSDDAAVALAEMVAQSEQGFVSMMNEHATYFGLNETKFVSVSGDSVTKGKNDENVSSARDVALLARKLVQMHPEVLYFAGKPSFQTSAGDKRENTNLMLSGKIHELPGIDGLKTGYTDVAGPCFVSTGIFEGRRIVTVVIGVEVVDGDKVNPRFELTQDLIERFIF